MGILFTEISMVIIVSIDNNRAKFHENLFVGFVRHHFMGPRRHPFSRGKYIRSMIIIMAHDYHS